MSITTIKENKQYSMNTIYLRINVSVNRNKVNIYNYHTVNSRRDMYGVIKDLKETFIVPVLNRSSFSLVNEWTMYNNLYKLKLFRPKNNKISIMSSNKWYYLLACFLMGVVKI